MRAAQHERVRLEAGLRGFVEQFGKIDPQHFVRDGVVDPAFLDQRNQQWAGLFDHAQAPFSACSRICVAFDRSGSGHDQHIAGFCGRLRRICPCVDHAKHRNRDCLADRIERQCGRGIAGDHQVIRLLLLDKEVRAGDGVARHGRLRLGSVGKPGGIPQVGVVCAGQALEQSAQNGEAPKP